MWFLGHSSLTLADIKGNVGGGRSGEAEKRDIQYGDDKNMFKWSHLKSNLWFLN